MTTIEIGKSKYKIGCSAITYMDYKEKFGRNIYTDLNIVLNYEYRQAELSINLAKENSNLSQYEIANMVFEKTIDKLDEYIECITKLCWICIYHCNKDIEDYNTWYKSLERLSLSDKWLEEVVSALADCFR